MMRKTLSRLLALVLVLCMVMVYVPIQAQAVDLTRPEGLTDEEWEVLRQKLLAQLALEQAEATPPATSETLPETDSLSKTETGELVVTDTAKDSGGADTDQSVSVELPVKGDEIKTTEEGETTNEFDTTTTVKGNETDVTVTESYNLEATVGTTSDGDQVTDVEYNISLDAAISAEKKPEDGDGTTTEDVVKSTVITDLDKTVNSAAEDSKKPAAQYKVNMTVNGMKDDPTRVEHKESESSGKVEYFYNAANGIDENDSSKKYFTVTEVTTEEKDESGNIISTVKDKVVSLWTSFLGIFHITNDAFENQDTKEMSSDLGTAVNDAKDNETVGMLRDYTTDQAAVITTDKDVTVDLNEHTYSYTEKKVDKNNAAILINGSNQSLTIQDGYIDSDNRGIRVNGDNNNVTIDNVAIDYADLGVGDWGEGNTITVEDSAIVAKEDADGDFGIYHNGSKGDATISVVGSYVYANSATSVGIYVSGNKNLEKNTLTITDSDVLGETGVEVKFTDVTIHDGYLVGFGEPGKYKENGNGSTTVGAALAVTDNKDGITGGTITINSGWFYGSKDIENIYLAAKKEANDPQATIAIYGGRFANAAGLTKYTAKNRATISHNDGSTYVYEVVTKDYIPTRDGYRFLGYTDSKGNAITLAEAMKKGVVAYAQWKELPETTKTASPLIVVKTEEKNCTTKYTIKGDTIYATVKDADGEFAPISEVTIPSVKRLQEREIDTVEIRVDEDVTLVLDVEKAKENGFTDVIEVTLEEDVLLITSGKKTCIELNIADLKASDKPVEIQLVEGELTIKLGKNSALTVDLTKALETGERIVVKLENGVLKLYDKYNKPIETEED